MKKYVFAVPAMLLSVSASGQLPPLPDHWQPPDRDPLNPTFNACRIGISDFRDDLCGILSRGPGKPRGTDGELNCSYDAEKIATKLCTINTPQGPIVAPHSAIQEPFRVGDGECGVTLYTFTCQRTSPVRILKENQRITVYTGHTEAQTALAYCHSLSPSTDKFTAFTTYDKQGGGAGWTYIDVMCFAP